MIELPPPAQPPPIPNRPRPKRRRITAFGVGLACLLYGISLPLPAFLFAHDEPVQGYAFVLLGWFGLLALNVGWLANVFFAVAIFAILIRWYRLAAVLSGLATLCALHSPFVHDYWFNEAHSTPILALGSAFYVWLSAIIVLTVTSIEAMRFAVLAERKVDSSN